MGIHYIRQAVKSTIEMDNGDVYDTSLQALYTYRRVLYDWQRSDYLGVITRPGLPCVFRCGTLLNSKSGSFCKLDEKWQYFMLDIMAFSYFGRYKENLSSDEYTWVAKKQASVYDSGRAFCNENHGFEAASGNRNFPLGTNKTSTSMPAIYSLVCGGAGVVGPVVKNSNGIQMIDVYHFDGNQDPPPVSSIDIYSDPRIFFANTVSGSKSKGYHIYKFPQLLGKDVPVPIVSTHKIYFPLKDTESYTGPERPYAYFP